MNYYKILLALFVFTCFTTAGNCSPLSSQGAYGEKLNLQDTSSMSAKANRKPSMFSSSDSGLTDDPFVNSAINGVGNMIQGMTNGAYSAAEQQRQQMDYAKQQMEFTQE